MAANIVDTSAQVVFYDTTFSIYLSAILNDIVTNKLTTTLLDTNYWQVNIQCLSSNTITLCMFSQINPLQYFYTNYFGANYVRSCAQSPAAKHFYSLKRADLNIHIVNDLMMLDSVGSKNAFVFLFALIFGVSYNIGNFNVPYVPASVLDLSNFCAGVNKHCLSNLAQEFFYFYPQLINPLFVSTTCPTNMNLFNMVLEFSAQSYNISISVNQSSTSSTSSSTSSSTTPTTSSTGSTSTASASPTTATLPTPTTPSELSLLDISKLRLLSLHNDNNTAISIYFKENQSQTLTNYTSLQNVLAENSLCNNIFLLFLPVVVLPTAHLQTTFATTSGYAQWFYSVLMSWYSSLMLLNLPPASLEEYYISNVLLQSVQYIQPPNDYTANIMFLASLYAPDSSIFETILKQKIFELWHRKKIALFSAFPCILAEMNYLFFEQWYLQFINNTLIYQNIWTCNVTFLCCYGSKLAQSNCDITENTNDFTASVTPKTLVNLVVIFDALVQLTVEFVTTIYIYYQSNIDFQLENTTTKQTFLCPKELFRIAIASTEILHAFQITSSQTPILLFGVNANPTNIVTFTKSSWNLLLAPPKATIAELDYDVSPINPPWNIIGTQTFTLVEPAFVIFYFNSTSSSLSMFATAGITAIQQPAPKTLTIPIFNAPLSDDDVSNMLYCTDTGKANALYSYFKQIVPLNLSKTLGKFNIVNYSTLTYSYCFGGIGYNVEIVFEAQPTTKIINNSQIELIASCNTLPYIIRATEFIILPRTNPSDIIIISKFNTIVGAVVYY